MSIFKPKGGDGADTSTERRGRTTVDKTEWGKVVQAGRERPLTPADAAERQASRRWN